MRELHFKACGFEHAGIFANGREVPFVGKVLAGLFADRLTDGGADVRDFAKAVKAAADLSRSGFASEIERNMRRLPAALETTGAASADGAA